MKRILKTIFLIIACCNAAAQTYAQEIIRSSDTATKKKQTPLARFKAKAAKPITHEMSGGIRLNTDGWSIFTDIGKVKTQDMKHIDMFHSVRILQIEFTEKKNPAEYKAVSPDGTGTNSYIYGKINNFYALKLGWGYRRLIAGKPDPGTVSIHWVNVVGVSIGLLKPYYLNVDTTPSTIEYKNSIKDVFLNPDKIEGSAGFSKGLSQITVIPGLHFKSAIHFDFSSNRKNVIGVETGVNAEYYSAPVPLMANQAATPYFVDLFIAAQFGRRW